MSPHRLKLDGLVTDLWATLVELAVALALLAGCAVFCPTTPAGAEILWLLMYVPTETGANTRDSLRYARAARFLGASAGCFLRGAPNIITRPAATPPATSCARWAWTSREWPSST
jgi:hypothetical protein